MTSVPLSLRMKTILNFAEQGKPVWDLCCDHGYMGYAAWQLGLSPQIHFVDQVESIIETLKQKWTNPAFHFHAQAGEDLSWDQVTGNVILSGVGAHTCLKILEQIPLTSHLRLIISPQKDPQHVRRWLHQRGWKLALESVLIERGRFRQVIAVESSGDDIKPFGNSLWEQSETGHSYWAFLRGHFTKLGARGEQELRELDWPRPGPVADFIRFDCQDSLPEAKI